MMWFFIGFVLGTLFGIMTAAILAANEFEYEAKKMEKWAKEELDKREGEAK